MFVLYEGEAGQLSVVVDICWNKFCLSCLDAGLPTLTVVICGILGVYGKYNLELSGGNDEISTTAQM